MSKLFFICNVVFIGGVFVYTLFFRHGSLFQEFEPYVAKEVVVEGMVAKDPQEREYGRDIIVHPNGFGASILIRTDGFSYITYGDEVHIQGILELAPQFEDFHYRDFLEAKGIGAVMKNPSIEVLSSPCGRCPEGAQYKSVFSFVYAHILFVKQKFRQVIFENTSPPVSTFLKALLLGDQGSMDKDLKDKLNTTGLRHIVAISGQHIVILTNMLVPLLLGLGLWRKQAIAGAFFFMAFFVVLTGAEASAVRSGIMGGVLLLSQYLGRMRTSLYIIAFAAVFMLLQNPLLLTKDVGFQLSFLATLGIILASPFVRRVLHRIPKHLGLRDMIAMNIAAQLFTLPLVMYTFGYISLVGIVANILVLPIIPLLLGLGFIFLLLGSVSSLIGIVLVFPISLLTKYFILVMEIFARFPFSRAVF